MRVPTEYVFVTEEVPNQKLDQGFYLIAVKKLEYRGNVNAFHMTALVAPKSFQQYAKENIIQQVPLLVDPTGKPL
jgi:hypothetical protein